MAIDPFRIKRIATKLEAAWFANSQLTLGQLIEQIENLAWGRYYAANPTRHFTARLSELPDLAFEQGLNDWIAGKRSDVGRQVP